MQIILGSRLVLEQCFNSFLILQELPLLYNCFYLKLLFLVLTVGFSFFFFFFHTFTIGMRAFNQHRHVFYLFFT